MWTVTAMWMCYPSPIRTTPCKISLFQNYPNPFNPTTTFRYRLYEGGFVTLAVYDALGQKIATLVNGKQSAGEHTVVFDAGNLASGIYYYRFSVDNRYSAVNKMALLR